VDCSSRFSAHGRLLPRKQRHGRIGTAAIWRINRRSAGSAPSQSIAILAGAFEAIAHCQAAPAVYPAGGSRRV